MPTQGLAHRDATKVTSSDGLSQGSMTYAGIYIMSTNGKQPYSGHVSLFGPFFGASHVGVLPGYTEYLFPLKLR